MKAIDYSQLTERRCSMCRLTLPVSAFGTYKAADQPINGWRYYARCRECSRQASRVYGAADRARRNRRLRDWRRRNPVAARALDRRKRLNRKGLATRSAA